MAVYLDTHVVVWLYEGRLDLIPEATQQLLEDEPLLISPLVSLELQYLYEIRKIRLKAVTILADLQARIGLEACDQPFARVVHQALTERWTRDPFDRLIVAQAKISKAPLVTKDRIIRRHYRMSRWA